MGSEGAASCPCPRRFAVSPSMCSLPPWVPCTSRVPVSACLHVTGAHRCGVRPLAPLGELDCISTFGSMTSSWSVFVSGLWGGDYPLVTLFPSHAPSRLLQLPAKQRGRCQEVVALVKGEVVLWALGYIRMLGSKVLGQTAFGLGPLPRLRQMRRGSPQATIH